MAPVILVTNWVHQPVIDRLRTVGTVIANDTRVPWSPEQLHRHAAQAAAMMAFMTDRVDAAFLDRCPPLRVIACALKGYDNFDIAACSARGVLVTIAHDLLTVPTAELTVGLMIAVGRQLPAADRFVRSGRFQGWRPQFYGTGLAGCTVGFLGMGAIGRAVAERLSGFGATLIFHDRCAPSVDDADRLKLTAVEFDTLLATSDFLVLATPLSADTRHIIGSETLTRLKPGAFLINPARGSLVDETAVGAALDAGALGGYAADVFELEDWARSDRPSGIPAPLLDQERRTVLTPHIGSAVDEVRLAIAMEAADSIVCALSGQVPPNAINADQVAASTDA